MTKDSRTADEMFQELTQDEQWIINSTMASCGIEGFALNEDEIKKLILETISKRGQTTNSTNYQTIKES